MAAEGSPMGYDATSTTLDLYSGSPDAMEVDHFVLR